MLTRSRTDLLGTWAALLPTRRSVPLSLVLGGTVLTEWRATRSLGWVAIDLVLFAAFCLVAPHAWRVLCAGREGAASIAGTLVHVALMGSLVGSLGWALPNALAMASPYVLESSGLPVVAGLFAVGGWGLGRDIELEARFEAERDRAGKLATEAERAELLALRANLDPHFLFNTLNAIAEWCREDPEVAEQATLELASMLRTMVEGIHAPSWRLDDELALARSVFELHAIRDRARYAYRVDLPAQLPDARVPPMLLLPLAENAITHGPAAGHDGEIVLRVEVEGSRVTIRLENPGPYAGRREGGQGIAMVERRLALAYGDDARLELSREGAQTRALLSIPMRPLVEEKLAS